MMTASQLQALPTNPKTSNVGGEPIVPELVQDLLDAALNLARTDESIADAQACAPPLDDVGAQKWHDVSVRALSWTRSALASKQDLLLKQLLEQTQLRCKASALSTEMSEIQLKAKTASKAISAPLSPDAAPFRPGPPGVWIMPSPEAKMNSVRQADPLSHDFEADSAAGSLQGIGSLREDLMRLREYDAARCLIVRRIKRLGLQSADLLRKYFERFGCVSEVLVAHSFEKKSAKCRCDRIRPAALGFIVMEDADAALAAIVAGPTLEVARVQINVTKFEAFEDGETDHDEIKK